MAYKTNFKLILGAATIAILAAGCQLSSPSGSVPPNNSTEEATNSSLTTGGIATASDRIPDLNLTDTQKAKAKQIGEQTQAKILALLNSEQQEKFKAASQDQQKSPMRVLRSLNLSAEQKQKIRDIQRNQRQEFQAILTPEQQAKMKQHRESRGER
ncbi:MAG: Spy/CpxP family protein refolding chaperone [Aulosira sp. ZfuVER01]|nr:Spy/CpxP family protein refolding chaperone [Aulosira sp. ZfuVER01]MDZ7997206.1 Spy/CpxP family protein refolding chaperone [Aulosira sp. DedVER01a]MDZ8056019.1 Spy/CpxP family protein refolding chaperone [Aulosira sp. ZfuCHP01]